MAAIIPTKKYGGEFAGEEKLKAYTVTLGSASDTVDLSAEFDTIHAVVGQLQGGHASTLMAIECTFSGTTVTIASFNDVGGAATAWASAAVTLLVLGTTDGI